MLPVYHYHPLLKTGAGDKSLLQWNEYMTLSGMAGPVQQGRGVSEKWPSDYAFAAELLL